jgi:hypothetical protein
LPPRRRAAAREVVGENRLPSLATFHIGRLLAFVVDTM